MVFQKGGLLALSMAVSALMACAHAPEGYRVPGSKPDGLRVIKTDGTVKPGLSEWWLAMPLGVSQDASVLEFLAQAEAAGARYVSDVKVVFAAEEEGQWRVCQTRIQPVLALESGTHSVLREGSGFRMTTDHVPGCLQGRVCVQVLTPPVGTRSSRYLFQSATHMSSSARMPIWRWRLQKSAPECAPLKGGEEALAGRFLRVEGHAYGCGDASGSGCEDRVL